MRAIDARPLAATSAALTTGGAKAAACWSRSSAAMRLIAWESLAVTDALCWTCKCCRCKRSSPVERAEPWYAAMRVHWPKIDGCEKKPVRIYKIVKPVLLPGCSDAPELRAYWHFSLVHFMTFLHNLHASI